MQYSPPCAAVQPGARAFVARKGYGERAADGHASRRGSAFKQGRRRPSLHYPPLTEVFSAARDAAIAAQKKPC